MKVPINRAGVLNEHVIAGIADLLRTMTPCA
jgi:hypothetical protein